MEAGRGSDGDGQGLLNEVRLLRSKRRNSCDLLQKLWRFSTKMGGCFSV